MTDETKVATSRDGPGGLLPGSAVRTRRQRRPTGAPPPLPHPFAVSTAAWLLLAAVVLAGAILITQHSPSLRLDNRFSTWVLGGLAGIRTPWLTDVANGIKVAGSSWGVTVLGLSAVALTMVLREDPAFTASKAPESPESIVRAVRERADLKALITFSVSEELFTLRDRVGPTLPERAV